MECGRRRRGNRRNSCHHNNTSTYTESCQDSPCRLRSGLGVRKCRRGILASLCNFLILMTLMALIYQMLEYHCTTCKNKCDMSAITKNIEDITKNLSHLKNGYQGLEIQISKFSNEIPRLQGQLEILESIANTLEKNESELGWNPKHHYSLPNVDVYLTKTGCNGKNVSRLVKSVAYNIEDCKDAVCLNNQCPASV